MPDLVGLPYAEGQKLLAAALDAAGNDRVIQARTRMTNRAPLGTFIDQSPKAGTVLTSKTQVRIYVEGK